MALFDAAEGRIIVRIVYDGLAGAGKTTNLRQLCQFFTPVRRGELYTPEESEGRTMYFDWLQLEGGIVAGHPLRCELVTVPGQVELESRRELLLETADGIVFVCDSAVDDLTETRQRLAAVRSRVRGSLSVPVVLQANKQDAPGAIPAAELATALDAHDLLIVPARASDGNGVREAAVMAIRAVADRIQRFVLTHGTDGLVGVATRPRELYESMRRPAPDPAPVAEPAPTPALAPSNDEPADLGTPPLPHAAVTTGMVWPAVSGRQTLRSLENTLFVLRDDLVGRNDGDDGSGKSDAIVYQAGAWCLKTSLRRRFEDVDEARGVLLRLARKKLALEQFLPPRTTATVVADAHGAQWLWTIAPWATTLRTEMTAAAAVRDQDALGVALCTFADAAVQALQLLATRGLSLDVHPSNFARVEGRVVYLDDDVDETPRILTFGHALLRRIDEYCRFEHAVDVYIEHAVDELRRALPLNGPTRLDVLDSIEGARPLTSAGQAARSILLEALERRALQRNRA